VELQLSAEQEIFGDTTRKFLDEHMPVAGLRALRHDPAGFPPDYWRRGAGLGWTALLVSEQDGGGAISARPLEDLAIVAYEFGRHAAPGPLASTNIVAGALSRSGSPEQRAATLPGLLAGELVGTWCFAEPRPNDALGSVTTQATISAGVRLSGVKAPVEAGAQAAQFLVTARSGGGLTQLLVPADAPGVTVTAMQSIDLTRRFAAVRFDDVELPPSAVVGEAGGAGSDVDWQLRVAVALTLAEMVGAMDRAFEITVQWAFDRYSFGRPLASYQELKHRFADMKMWLEASHAIADGAVRAVAQGAPDAWELLSAGKAYVGHYGIELIQDCVQMHGGIGVTFEHDMHLYLRRATLGSRLYGSVAEHRERLTAALEAQVEAQVEEETADDDRR
jgi:alkylation response protein AidB-like acyl-CoA dehydrogenase